MKEYRSNEGLSRDDDEDDIEYDPTDEVAVKQERAKLTSWAVNILGTLAVVLSFIKMKDNSFSPLLFSISLLAPIAILWLYRYFDGLLLLTSGNGSPSSSMAWGIWGITLAGVANAFNTPFSSGDHSFLILITILTTACIYIIIRLFNMNSVKNETLPSVLLVLIIPCLVYAGILFVFVNCYCDKAEVTIYHPKVMNTDTFIGRKGRRKYVLILEPWGKLADPQRKGVEKNIYSSMQVGSTITVCEHPGLLACPWHTFEYH